MTTMAMNQGIKIEHTLHIGITSRAFNRSGQTESYCYQAIRELVDNAIAARKKGKKASIWISMATDSEDKNFVWLVLATGGWEWTWLRWRMPYNWAVFPSERTG